MHVCMCVYVHVSVCMRVHSCNAGAYPYLNVYLATRDNREIRQLKHKCTKQKTVVWVACVCMCVCVCVWMMGDCQLQSHFNSSCAYAHIFVIKHYLCCV